MPGATAAAAGLGPVGVAVVIGVSVVGLYATFKEWLHRGELKLAATATAEEYVDTIWGTRQPNSPPVEDSVSKLIEECKLGEAQELINFLGRQMFDKAERDSYFKRWFDEWGKLTLEEVQAKLDAYRGYCIVSEPEHQSQSQPAAPLPVVSPPVLPPAIEPTTGAHVPMHSSSLGTLSGTVVAGFFGFLILLAVKKQRKSSTL